jgi:hypothetical protein
MQSKTRWCLNEASMSSRMCSQGFRPGSYALEPFLLNTYYLYILGMDAQPQVL